MKYRLVALTRDPVSLTGAALTTAAAVLILTFFGLGFVGFHGGPYLGILTYLILPAVFAAGLLLIPVGGWRHRRRQQRAQARGEPVRSLPVIDLNDDRARRGVLIFVALSMVNVTILALASYKGVEVLDSNEFCGTTCHTPMTPEYTAYRRSPHSRVACVACHVGPGADSFLAAKLAGARQAVLAVSNRFARPIPTPLRNQKAAPATCLECHGLNPFIGERLKVIARHSEDEQSTPLWTVLTMKVGGGAETQGIHWHADPRTEIRYRSDESRERIDELELRRPDGSVATFRRTAPSKAAEQLGDTQPVWRTMDCVDCHNRPAHTFRGRADELDQGLAGGRLDRSLPFLKREAMKVLGASYASQEEARREIPARLEAFYAANYPDRLRAEPDAAKRAGATLAEMYCANVFPDMKVTWDTYARQLGHLSSPGCFRCHGDELKTKEGESISQECSLCHAVLAMDDEDPAVLKSLRE